MDHDVSTRVTTHAVVVEVEHRTPSRRQLGSGQGCQAAFLHESTYPHSLEKTTLSQKQTKRPIAGLFSVAMGVIKSRR